MFLWLMMLLFTQLSVVAQSTSSTMYVFAYSWTPGFCNGQSYPGCENSLNYWKQNFTIHGLWPQYITSGYPSTCTTEPFDPNIPIDIGLDYMIERWPDVQYAVNTTKYDSFWEHEWTKHGTCSGLSQHDYFTTALSMTNLLITPEIIHNSIGSNVSSELLRTSIAVPSAVSLQCHNQMLVGMYTCWQQVDNIPSKLVTCPTDVIHEDTCTSLYVYIPGLN
jgi:ribonuclease T2